MTAYHRPAPGELRRGARYGQHVLPSHADDLQIQSLVQAVFAPQPLFPNLPGYQPCDPVLVRQLVDHAPQTDRTGQDDWNRPLRADEVAEIWGEPMEGDPLDVRISWLRRADEVCRAWGRPLAGLGGLAPEMTLPPATDQNPED